LKRKAGEEKGGGKVEGQREEKGRGKKGIGKGGARIEVLGGIESLEQRTIIQQHGDWYTGR